MLINRRLEDNFVRQFVQKELHTLDLPNLLDILNLQDRIMILESELLTKNQIITELEQMQHKWNDAL